MCCVYHEWGLTAASLRYVNCLLLNIGCTISKYVFRVCMICKPDATSLILIAFPSLAPCYDGEGSKHWFSYARYGLLCVYSIPRLRYCRNYVQKEVVSCPGQKVLGRHLN